LVKDRLIVLCIAACMLAVLPAAAQEGLTGDVKITLSFNASRQAATDGFYAFKQDYWLVNEQDMPVGGMALKVSLQNPPDPADVPIEITLPEGNLTGKYSFVPKPGETTFEIFLDLSYSGQLDAEGIVSFVLKHPNGTIFVLLNVSDIEDTPAKARISDGGAILGEVAVDDTGLDVAVPLPVVQMTLVGDVTYSDGVLVQSGTVTITRPGATTEAALRGGRYEAILGGPEGETLTFSVNGIAATPSPSITLTSGTFEVNLVLNAASSTTNFPDADRDGIPDLMDECPGSMYPVDEFGCDCRQKAQKCSENRQGCAVVNGVAMCAPTCKDGFQNQDETGVDCGGPCWQCPVEGRICDTPDNCLPDAPNWCSPESVVKPNCGKCGCPEDFICQADGRCAQLIERKGLKCPDTSSEGLAIEYQVLSGADCKQLGQQYERLDHMKFFSVSVSGNPRFIAKKVKKKVEGALKNIAICIATKDLGCVALSSHCVSEDSIEESKPEAQAVMQQEVDKYLSGAKSSMSGIERFLMQRFRVRIKVKVDLSSLTTEDLDRTYQCPPLTVNPERACIKLIDNGPKTKADLVLLGDGYFTSEEFASVARQLLDYDGTQAGKETEGLFSIPPLADNRQKFNVWILTAEDRIARTEDPFVRNYGVVPDDGSVLQALTPCQTVDYAVVISRTDAYRSSCDGSSVPPLCKVSLAAEEFPGRLLAHELGHGIGKLEDEYYNPVTVIDQPGALQSPSFGGPNCATDQKAAEASWAALVNPQTGVSYFLSCGDDAGSATAIRPTFSSVMNQHRMTCGLQPSKEGILQPEDDPECGFGPPFNQWNQVNSREIIKELDKYT